MGAGIIRKAWCKTATEKVMQMEFPLEQLYETMRVDLGILELKILQGTWSLAKGLVICGVKYGY